jgi:hypothetical protein
VMITWIPYSGYGTMEQREKPPRNESFTQRGLPREGGKGKRGRTASDDAGGKSLSDTSTSAGAKSTVIRISVKIFEASKRDKP